MLVHLSIALGPLAVYFVLMGLINLIRRPFVTTGARDTAALGVAISGFIAVGPMDLFLPESTANQFGALAWVLLFLLYSMSVTLLVLLMRPRIVIYNIAPDQLRPVLAKVASELDGESRWAGEALTLPELGVHMFVELVGATRHAVLAATGPRQDFGGWRKLELALTEALRQSRSASNPAGYFWMLLGVTLVTIVMSVWFVSDPATVKQALRSILRM